MGQIGLGYALRGILGVNTVVHNLACTPTVPASLQVTIGVGAIYTLDTLDTVAYSDLGLDQSQIIKQGLLLSPTTLTITPPGTSGQSQVYLVEAILSDIDTGSAVLPYYNATNPGAPFSGPGNNGMSQFTTRSVQCTIALKAGAAAPTGSQVTPTPDAGYTGLYAITVVNGQTAITSGNIVLQPTAPFFPTLPSVPNDVQTSAWTYFPDQGVQNAMVATMYPPITSLVPGTGVSVRAAFGNTGIATLNLNGTGAQPIHRANGANLSSGDYNAGQIVSLMWDGAAFQIINFFGFTASTTNNNNFVISIPFAVDSGSINAMTGLYSPALTSLAAGQTVEIQVSNTNTGASTLICNALAAKPILQNGVPLLPRALVAGQVVLMVFDGTSFQLMNTRWPYQTWDTATAPGSDQFLAIGDQVNITFTGALSIPLKIATVPGAYEIVFTLSIGSAVGLDCDVFLMPNNVQQSSNPGFWNSQIVSNNVNNNTFPYMNNSVGPGLAVNPNVGPSSTLWYDTGNPSANVADNAGLAGTFWFDMFLNQQLPPAFGDTGIDSGPVIIKAYCSTFTNAKQIMWNGVICPAPSIGWSRWWDRTTAWTSLGTLGVTAERLGLAPQYLSAVSGVVTIKRWA
jgi:hypothetical protein